MSRLITQNGYRYIYDGDGQLVVKMDEASGARSIYLGSYAEVTYTGAAAATPTPSATLSPTVTRTPVPSRTSTLTPTKSRTPTRTATATKTNTPSRTRTPTKTATRITQTKTNTKTVVVQTVYSVTPILSKTATPTRTSTITPTATKTATRTSTSTRKAFGWPTNTPTFTPTTTITHSPVPTNTATPIPNLAGMAWKFYYLAGSERVAMRVIDGGSNQLYYLFTDHLGSTSEVRRADGSLHSRQYYRAFGEERYTTGALPPDRTYTGQREIEFGLVHYGARIYDPR